MIGEFLEFILGGAFDLVNMFIDMLPAFPIEDFDSIITPSQGSELILEILSWVNWLLPLDQAGTMIFIWTSAILVYIAIKSAWDWGEKILP